MTFTKWIDTFIAEKGLDAEHEFLHEGANGLNIIPLGCVVEAIKQTVGAEQAKIKQTLVMIDFRNGDVCHFFNHLAKALAR